MGKKNKKKRNNTNKRYYYATVQGLRVRIDANVFDDIKCLELVSEIDEGNALAIPKLMRIVFKGGEYDKVYNHLNKNGVTSATDMANFMTEVINSVYAIQAKN